jgi:hypothetical protein
LGFLVNNNRPTLPLFLISVHSKGLGMNNCAKRANSEGADFEAFRDRGFGKCVEAWGYEKFRLVVSFGGRGERETGS